MMEIKVFKDKYISRWVDWENPGLSSVMHFAWFLHIHARIEQFVSFVMHFPISKQIFETEFEYQKKIRFPEYYTVPPYTPAHFVDIILVSFVLQTKVTGFGHSLFYILNLGSVFYCKCAKIESMLCVMKWKLKTFGNPSRSVSQG